MEEAEVVLRHHRAAVHTETSHLERRPDRIAREELVVRRDARELHHAELHHQMVDQLLRFRFRQRASLQIALDINVEEGRDTAHRHRGAVLRLDGAEVAEVEPLHGLASILRRCRNVVAIDGRHLLEALERLDLHRDLLAQTDHVVRHHASAVMQCQVLLLLLDQEIHAVKRHAAVVAHDASAAVGIRQTGEDVVVSHGLHLLRVGIKHAVVVRFVILREDLVQLLRRLVAIRRAGLFGHLDTAVRHECALERLVGLQTHDALQILRALGDVSRSVGRQTRDDLRLHIEYTALGALLLLQALQDAPQLLRGLGWALQEAFAAVISRVIVLNKSANVHFIRPLGSLEPVPFLSHFMIEFLLLMMLSADLFGRGLAPFPLSSAGKCRGISLHWTHFRRKNARSTLQFL